MAKGKLSVEERRRRNAEYQKKWREKLNSQPELKDEFLRKERERWAHRVQDGKVKTISDLNGRKRRKRRKFWKEAQRESRERRKKAQEIQQSLNTPPDSPLDISFEQPSRSRQLVAGERLRNRTRQRHYREIKTLKGKLEKVKKDKDKLRKRLKRRKLDPCQSTEESPRTKTQSMLQGSKIRNPLVKKTLLFHHVLSKALHKNVHHTHKSGKLTPHTTLSGKILKKYRMMHQVREFGFSYKTLKEKTPIQRKPNYIQMISSVVHTFFENNARITTDKQDTITRKKVKRQRMIMTDTMQNLHYSFTEQNPSIRLSYSSFCALRPFYITAPKTSDRKTCQCQYHENAKLMFDVLKSYQAVSTSKLEETFQLVCCSPASESCLLRTCARCLHKSSSLPLEEGKAKVEWKQWERVEEQTEDGVHFHTRLQKRTVTLLELMDLYQDKLRNETTTHVHLVQNQSKEYRNMIQNCNETTGIVHVDFSEAWKCKYSSEVQSCHYGQNLPQITLHTGMFYTKQEKQAFCTISESKRQDAAAIWTYMDQVLKNIHTRFPHIDTVHFWSDGPSKQYKNKKNFLLLSIIPPQLGFKNVTWNFFPTSHGKGAPDGIGATVKRCADRIVVGGLDIVNGTTFHQLVSSKLSGVYLHYVSNDDFLTCDAVLPKSLRSIPGTRKVHQVVAQGNTIYCRHISCFCNEPQICRCFNPVAHHHTQDADEHRPVQSPLAMLMEAMEKEPSRAPEGLMSAVGPSDINTGDWLSVVYDYNWWLAKVLKTDQEHRDVQVEFFHPHGPSSHFQKKQGSQDVCYVPFADVIVKHQSSPVRTSRSREIYQLSPEVMDFIDEELFNRLLPGL
ncbi:hypothetical protein ACEWY4_003792 [Coilia grayii]|uniref:Uncharacterized protein n=1 Tax=Coilia grayii TaxID=363190 RepID=A0ABD1KSV5_9TELE